jgi:hypothetical protein
MGWPFRRSATSSPLARELFDVREGWEATITENPDLEAPNRMVLLGASAGATVAVGAFATLLHQQLRDAATTIALPNGREVVDRVTEFTRALDRRPAIEAAYRVVTWAFVGEFGAFFWRPNYELELHACAEAFGLHNEFEGEVAALGEPLGEGASVEEEGAREYALQKATLAAMIGAATGKPLDWETDVFVAFIIPAWQDQFIAGKRVAKERLGQLAPEGLPIWEA